MLQTKNPANPKDNKPATNASGINNAESIPSTPKIKTETLTCAAFHPRTGRVRKRQGKSAWLNFSFLVFASDYVRGEKNRGLKTGTAEAKGPNLESDCFQFPTPKSGKNNFRSKENGV